ncbi:MAG: HAMP domain-containing sensor histidine kinase [Thermoleophilia bacterium]
MSRISRRVLGSYVALIVLVVLSVSVASGFVLKRELLSNLEDDMVRQARQLAVGLNSMAETGAGPATDPAVLESWITDAGTAFQVRLTVIAADGRVLADSDELPNNMDNHAGRPEVVLAMAGGEGRSRRFSATLGKETIYVAVRLGRGSSPWSGGVVRVAIAADRIDPLLSHVWWLPLALGALALVPALAAAYLLSRSLTRPIERLRAMAVNVAKGELSFRVATPRRTDELGELARALNHMAADLEHRVADLTRERARMADILASMDDGVLVVDVDGIVVGANPAATRMIGASTEPIEGRPLVRTARMFPARALMDGALKQGTSSLRRVELPGDRSLEVNVIPLQGAGQETRQVLMVMHDETERVRVDRIRKDFVANVSHELKTPLAGLSLLASTLQQALDDDPEGARGFARRLRGEIERLTDLVVDLLALSELDERPSGGGAERVLVDVAVLAREVTSSFQARAQEREIALEIDAPRAAVVNGDPVTLATMVRNLVDNALRYTQPGGRVAVAVATTDEQVTVTVSDDGIGIPRDDRERIFERFYRVDRARSRETGGTGLGLSIVKNVAQAHAGSVRVQSAVGVGSTFTVELPAAGDSG